MIMCNMARFKASDVYWQLPSLYDTDITYGLKIYLFRLQLLEVFKKLTEYFTQTEKILV